MAVCVHNNSTNRGTADRGPANCGTGLYGFHYPTSSNRRPAGSACPSCCSSGPNSSAAKRRGLQKMSCYERPADQLCVGMLRRPAQCQRGEHVRRISAIAHPPYAIITLSALSRLWGNFFPTLKNKQSTPNQGVDFNYESKKHGIPRNDSSDNP